MRQKQKIKSQILILLLMPSAALTYKNACNIPIVCISVAHASPMASSIMTIMGLSSTTRHIQKGSPLPAEWPMRWSVMCRRITTEILRGILMSGRRTLVTRWGISTMFSSRRCLRAMRGTCSIISSKAPAWMDVCSQPRICFILPMQWNPMKWGLQRLLSNLAAMMSLFFTLPQYSSHGGFHTYWGWFDIK